MSNGLRCCALYICCPPPGPGQEDKRVSALASELAKAGPLETCNDVAAWMLGNYDLVPKGLGAAIVEAYRPEFAKLHAHKEADHVD